MDSFISESNGDVRSAPARSAANTLSSPLLLAKVEEVTSEWKFKTELEEMGWSSTVFILSRSIRISFVIATSVIFTQCHVLLSVPCEKAILCYHHLFNQLIWIWEKQVNWVACVFRLWKNTIQLNFRRNQTNYAVTSEYFIWIWEKQRAAPLGVLHNRTSISSRIWFILIFAVPTRRMKAAYSHRQTNFPFINNITEYSLKHMHTHTCRCDFSSV